MPQKTKKHLLLPLLLIFYLLSPVISFAETKKPLNQSKLKSQSNPPRFIIIQHSYSQNPANINMGELKGGNIEIIKEFTIDNVYNILLDKHHLPGNELFFTRSFGMTKDEEYILKKFKFSLETGKEKCLGSYEPLFSNFQRYKPIKFYEVEYNKDVEENMDKEVITKQKKSLYVFPSVKDPYVTYPVLPEAALRYLKNPWSLEDYLEKGYSFVDFQLSDNRKMVSVFVIGMTGHFSIVVFPFDKERDSSPWNGEKNDFRDARELVQEVKNYYFYRRMTGENLLPAKCWSPDGNFILFSQEKGNTDIYKVDVNKKDSPPAETQRRL